MTRILLAILWLGSALALAQPNAEAAAEFDAGRQAFASNDYQLALRHFERAYELAPHDNARFNIGVCLERLGRFRDAAAQYDAAARSETLTDEDRARARQDAARVHARLATLHVRGRPDGAVVEVAGTSCILPCDIEIDPGSYQAIVHEPRQVQQSVTLERGDERTIELDASLLDAHLTTAVEGHELGWLIGIGATLFDLGLIGAIVFGIWTQDRLDHYNGLPIGDPALPGIAAEGNLARDLTNASWVTLAAGALIGLIDLTWWICDPQHLSTRPAIATF